METFGAILTRLLTAPAVEVGVMVTLPHVMVWAGLGAMGVVLVGAILTKAGVGNCVGEGFARLVAAAARIPAAGTEVMATGCWAQAASVGTNGGGVVGEAIILPVDVVILPVFVLFAELLTLLREVFA